MSPFLPNSVYLPLDEEQRLITNNLLLNQIVKAVNLREIGTYETSETITGESWFSSNINVKRAVYRQVYQIGALNAGSTLSMAHNISSLSQFTHIYGTCITADGNFHPLPDVSATNVTNQVSLDCTPTNIVIVNGSTAQNISSGLVILEYLKN